MVAIHESIPTASRDATITHTFDAPRERVFRAWVDPEQVRQWWGPHGFTNPVCELDVRPGGSIHIDMRGPDGKTYPMNATFREILEPERIVMVGGALDANGKMMFEVEQTITFEEHAGRTTVTVNARVLSATPAAAPHLAGQGIGWAQSLERLDAFLAKV